MRVVVLPPNPESESTVFIEVTTGGDGESTKMLLNSAYIVTVREDSGKAVIVTLKSSYHVREKYEDLKRLLMVRGGL